MKKKRNSNKVDRRRGLHALLSVVGPRRKQGLNKKAKEMATICRHPQCRERWYVRSSVLDLDARRLLRKGHALYFMKDDNGNTFVTRKRRDAVFYKKKHPDRRVGRYIRVSGKPMPHWWWGYGGGGVCRPATDNDRGGDGPTGLECPMYWYELLP